MRLKRAAFSGGLPAAVCAGVLTVGEAALILVVDDEPDILSLNRLILEREGGGHHRGRRVDAIQKRWTSPRT